MSDICSFSHRQEVTKNIVESESQVHHHGSYALTQEATLKRPLMYRFLPMSYYSEKIETQRS